ncbi:MAG TPA: N-formylglutamate amidohydrolase [Gammaproteobacteria bacterium]|nr:N-formylglutamate amidohydrolase [Gammaproteobacteria bacterium]
MSEAAQTLNAQTAGEAVPRLLLGADEPEPVGVREARGQSRVLVICDHAANRMPAALASLGVEPQRLQQHIAWDPGALGVARGLAELLDATLVFGRYSRLAADLNRAPEDSSAVPGISDGVLIPGNLGLSAQQRAERIRALHDPYHAYIARHLAAAHRSGIWPVLVSVHSFTPRVSGISRPWQAGVLWDKDSRIAIRLLQDLRQAGVLVGDNEPYSGRHTADYTLDRHAEGNGLAHAALELRQDCIANAGTQYIWAERLAGILRPILDDERLYGVHHSFGDAV